MAFRPNIKNKDGTLTDLPIAAETAVRLKYKATITVTGVTATPQDFDGTGNVEIPITKIPGKLLTGTTSIPTTGSAGSAAILNGSWTELVPGTTNLPYGVYLFKVEILDDASRIGGYATTFVDVLGMDKTSSTEYEARGYEAPSGPNHYYVANDAEARWYRSARLKVTYYANTTFRVDLFVSSSGVYSTSNITGEFNIADTLASNKEGISYKIKYKRIF